MSIAVLQSDIGAIDRPSLGRMFCSTHHCAIVKRTINDKPRYADEPSVNDPQSAGCGVELDDSLLQEEKQKRKDYKCYAAKRREWFCASKVFGVCAGR